MDAKERHELKDNDLAEFLKWAGEIWDKHGNIIAGAIVICAAGWFGYNYYTNQQAAQHENAWADLAITNTPQGFRERAGEQDDPALVNLALLRGAEAYHIQAVSLGDEQVDPESGLMSAEDSLANAEKMYKQVLDSKAAAPYRANAAAGLANVAETKGDFEAAATFWNQSKQIAEEARLSAITAQADTRLAMLDGLARPIILGDAGTPDETAPTAEVEPATDAAAEPVPSDIEAEAAASSEAPAEPTEPTEAPADPG